MQGFCILLPFFVEKIIALKALLTLHLCHDYWILLICLAMVQNQGNMHTQVVVDVSRGSFANCCTCRGANGLSGETESKKKLCSFVCT